MRAPSPGRLVPRQPLRADRLEHIIKRGMFESLYREFVEGGHEDYASVALDSFCHLEAGQPRHLDVEESQVRVQLGDAGGSVDAIAREMDDLQLGP
jgi:hypothetical protein